MRRVPLVALLLLTALHAGAKPRARALGIPFSGSPGPLNAITDVQGVEVGHATVIAGDSVRTGVTAIFPKGRQSTAPVFAGWFALNGNGEMTGTTWIDESGLLTTPVLLTNTHSVGTVHQAVIAWNLARATAARPAGDWSLPVVAETWDGFLNDINGFHVTKEHVFAALDGARGGAVAEGNVGGGTGMMTHEFKGGIGTSSRRLSAEDGGYTIGVLVQSNYGRREQLQIAGVPVGREITDLRPQRGKERDGSIIAVVATDAPLLPHQLERIAKRVSLGVAVVGGRADNSSGDIFVAFSTANPESAKTEGIARIEMLPNERLNPLLRATAEATEEAIVNALIAAETMRGRDGHVVHAIPHDRLREVLKKYNRLQ